MKISVYLSIACLFIATAARAVAGGNEFAGSLEVGSVLTSDRKAVFVVSGLCDLLLAGPTQELGTAQKVRSRLDHAVIVLQRSYHEYPTDKAWEDACEAFKHTVGKHIDFGSVLAHLDWYDCEVTLVQTEYLTVYPSKSAD